MARPASENPTGLEHEILKILWIVEPNQPAVNAKSQSALTVREIRDRLADNGRDMAHTSVITMLNIMYDKGYVDKRKDGKTFLYWPIVTEEDVSQKMLSDLVSRVFDGSARQLVLNLIDGEEIGEAELIELRKLINQKVREQRK